MSDDFRARWLHSRQLCTRCKTADAYTLAGHWYCADCSALRNARRQASRDKAARCAYDRARRVRLRDSGLCTRCGKRPPLPGGTRCGICRAKQRLACQRTSRAHSPDVNWPRGDNGICYQCNKRPAAPGKRLCPDCLAANRPPISPGRAFRKENDLLWTSL